MKTLREAVGGSPTLAWKNGRVTIKGDQIQVSNTRKFSKDTYPVAGAEGRVEASGQVYARRTVTRSLLAGPFAPSKKTDARELFLTIEGPTFQVALEIDADHQREARDFAAAINTRSRAGGISSGPPPPPSTPAGWYADPSGSPNLRWFDGATWTEHSSPMPTPPVV